ncbi:hypothetical protein Enr13x_28430 [Stieleria neptunia]|uniref:Uncharacterized protein n=1 Tax=Stieleria neptunia TaxID=2527979 RepID=A0A518HQC2_9BACT|nr:hypothetical protein Enr13x_28430 [Stieleria neptunia]
MSEWVLDDNRSVQTPLRRRGPVEGTKHLRRIADQVIPRRVAPPQIPSPLQLASPSDRTEPSDIAVIPQKTFPEYPRAATKIHEEPPLGETAFAQQANAGEGTRCKNLGSFRYDRIRHL